MVNKKGVVFLRKIYRYLFIVMLILLYGCSNSQDENALMNDTSENEENTDLNLVSEENESLTYLDETYDDPLFGEEYSYNYITNINDNEITLNEIEKISENDERWEESWESELGYVLKDYSDSDVTYILSNDSEIWILEDNISLHGKISINDLDKYIDSKKHNILWAIVVEDSQIKKMVECMEP